ncbi:MAG: GNAT family N-acetyltransferase [Erysipelotrichia bacterium]|nr:GNAT family N-acetyltransferase [Erysipelotrichia bacterium]
MLIREAHNEDLKGILEIYNQPDMDDGKTLSTAQAEVIFKRISNYPNYKIFVTIDDEKIIGTFAVAIIDNLAHMGATSGLIEDVVVKTDWQGKGVGKQMMEYAIEYCKKYECYKVVLSSNLKREKAHLFYESLGFKIHGYSFLL